MTDLTEQWKKGELPSGWYYVKKVNGQQDIAECYKVTDTMTNISYTEFEFSEDIEQVLAPVSSYEEWQRKDDALTALLAKYGKLTKELQDEKEKHMIRPSLRSPADETVIEKQVWESTLNRSMELQAENTKLKELLKECQSKLNYCTRETYELQTKINQALGEDK